MPRSSRLPRAGLSSLRGEGWVALSGSGPVGKGLTADDARAAAKLSRLKELTQVIYFPTDTTQPLVLPTTFDRARQALPDPSRVWLVGGSVRDALLNRPVHDLDFAVAGDGLAIARTVASKLGAAFFPLDESRGTGRVVAIEDDQRFFLDFASLRGDDLNADLAARDFTVNAIAVSLGGQLFDPMGGQADLKAKVLRTCSPASINDDPVRALRAVRLAAQLGFRIERGTREAAREAASRIASVSAERVRDEFMKMLEEQKPAASLRALDALGLLYHVVPETSALKGVTQSAPHVFDVWQHTLAVVAHLDSVLSVLRRAHDVDAASEYALGYAAARVGRYRNEISDHLEQELSVGRSARSLLFLAALLHDIAKPQTRAVEAGTGRVRFLGHENYGTEVAKERLIALRLSNDEVERVAIIVAHHMRPVLLSHGEAVRPRAAYRFFKATGPAGVDVCLLTLADLLGTRGIELGREEWAVRVDTVVALLDAYYKQSEQVIRPPALITGEDVMRLGVPQGPRVGELLEAVREAQAAGEVTTREEAMDRVKRLVEKDPSTD
ncbi:MAG TPA: HD domain-containing protein [Anaerolineales bacterium]|nr:HD domain-containing protein [Anaerolineales bacterium]